MRRSPPAECVSRCNPLGNEMTFLGIFEVGFTDGDCLGRHNARITEPKGKRKIMAMSLEQAWSHVTALWPNAERLDRHDGKLVACFKDSTIVVGPMFFYRIDPGIVDWPEGVLKYPESA